MQAEAALAGLAEEESALRVQLGWLRRERGEANRRVQLQGERLSLAQAELRRAEPVAARGFLPARELEATRTVVLQADLTLLEMSASVLTIDRQIGEAQSRLRAIPIEKRSARAEADSIQAGITQQKTQAESAATYIVVAAVAGRVSAIPVSIGQSLETGAAVAVVGKGDQPSVLSAPARICV